MDANEIAVTFACNEATLAGIVHVPETPRARGLLCVIAGGPQYRIGCCRQQVLLARVLAAKGTPVMRFDYRGMGDSGGFDPDLDRTDDISAAVDEFMRCVPGLREVVLYGGCDGASAIAISGWRQSAVTGWILNNPFTAMEEVRAKMMLKHYYRQRLFSKQLWTKVLRLQFDLKGSLSSVLQNLRKSRSAAATENLQIQDVFDPARPFTARMLEGWKRFNGDVLLLMGGRSLVAKEFDECVAASAEWQSVVGRSTVTRHEMPDADHTFSEPKSRAMLFDALNSWLESLPQVQGEEERGSELSAASKRSA